MEDSFFVSGRPDFSTTPPPITAHQQHHHQFSEFQVGNFSPIISDDPLLSSLGGSGNIGSMPTFLHPSENNSSSPFLSSNSAEVFMGAMPSPQRPLPPPLHPPPAFALDPRNAGSPVSAVGVAPEFGCTPVFTPVIQQQQQSEPMFYLQQQRPGNGTGFGQDISTSDPRLPPSPQAASSPVGGQGNNSISRGKPQRKAAQNCLAGLEIIAAESLVKTPERIASPKTKVSSSKSKGGSSGTAKGKKLANGKKSANNSVAVQLEFKGAPIRPFDPSTYMPGQKPNRFFGHLKRLQKLYQAADKTSKDTYCSQCEKFIAFGGMERHVCMHFGGALFACRLCSYQSHAPIGSHITSSHGQHMNASNSEDRRYFYEEELLETLKDCFKGQRPPQVESAVGGVNMPALVESCLEQPLSNSSVDSGVTSGIETSPSIDSPAFAGEGKLEFEAKYSDLVPILVPEAPPVSEWNIDIVPEAPKLEPDVEKSETEKSMKTVRQPVSAAVRNIIKLFGKWYRRKNKRKKKQKWIPRQKKTKKPTEISLPKTRKAKTCRFVVGELRKSTNCRIPYLRTYIEAACELRERKRYTNPVVCALCGSELFGKTVAGRLGVHHALRHCDMKLCWSGGGLDADLLEAFLLKVVFRCFRKDFS